MTQDAFGYGKTLNPNGRREGVQELAPETTKPGITLQQYADYVRLPQHYLRGELNLREMSHNGYPAVKIGYPDAEGKEPYYRLRLSLKGYPRFHSPRHTWGSGPSLMGCTSWAWRGRWATPFLSRAKATPRFSGTTTSPP